MAFPVSQRSAAESFGLTVGTHKFTQSCILMSNFLDREKKFNPSQSTPPMVPFSRRESDAAYKSWGANCGPHTVAAFCDLSLHEVRQYFEPFRGTTNPTLMKKVLRTLGLEFTFSKDLRTKQVKDGISYVQFEGPWLKPGALAVARYRYTHWIAVRNGWVFDTLLDSATWLKKEEWLPSFDATVEKDYVGWHIWQHYTAAQRS
jgi:hypothetical protein